MIYALKADRAGITLYNSDKQEAKVVSGSKLLGLIQQGLLLDNDEQFREMLEHGKEYKYFIKDYIGNCKLILGEVDNPEKETELSAYNAVTDDICNSITYRMHNKPGISIKDGLETRRENYGFTFDYTVVCGIDYETADKMAHSTNYELDQLVEQIGIFGESVFKDLGVQQINSTYLYTQVALDDTLKVEEFRATEGIALVHTEVMAHCNAKKLILPSSVIQEILVLRLTNKLDVLDLSSISVKEFELEIFAKAGTPGSESTAITDVYMPKSARCLLRSISDNMSVLNPVQKVVMMQNVFIGKNTKVICSGAIRAHCVILEKGINLDSIADYGIVARFVIMSDDPNYDRYVKCTFFSDSIKEKEYTVLDLGDSVEIQANSIRVLNFDSIPVEVRIKSKCIKEVPKYVMDMRDEDGNKLRAKVGG